MATPPQMVDFSLGARIRFAMREARLTVVGLADRVGVSRASMTEYVNDARDIPSRVLARMVKELRSAGLDWVSADWVLFGTTTTGL
ncbi:MAG TPA: helix-turn-helix transcriptional regulator [Actinomycetota bacterium]|nr:helix-turn-helix transcriptional regulator [Actinomycetota bacterium]